MNTSVNAPLSRPDISLYGNSDPKPMDLSLSRLSESIGGNAGGGQSPISFGGPDATSGASQNFMRPSPENLTADKTAGGAQGGDNDISKILEKIVQLLQELFQSLMQKPGEGEEGEGGPAPVGKSSGGAPAQAQAPSGAGGGGGGGAPAAGGPTGAPPFAQKAAVTDGAAPAQGSPAQGVAGIEGASGLHLPPAMAKHEEAIGAAAKASGQPANVIAGMMWAESRGNSAASTVNGGNGQSDSGLMQVNSATAAEVQSKHPEHFNENMTADEKNIMTGALYLKDQREAFGGDMNSALRAYNSGANTVNRDDPSDVSKTGLGDPNYVANVNNFAEIIGSGKGQLPA